MAFIHWHQPVVQAHSNVLIPLGSNRLGRRDRRSHGPIPDDVPDDGVEGGGRHDAADPPRGGRGVLWHVHALSIRFFKRTS